MLRGDVIRRILWWLAPAWAAAASAYLLLGPTITSVSSSVTLGPDGATSRSAALHTSTSLLAAQGASAVLPLLIPVLLAALPLLGRSSTARRVLGVIAALLLAVFCVLGILSIGLFYVPSVAVLLVVLALEATSSEDELSDAAA
jgi:hypothetical protein